ncbi:sialate O-acetylesterase [Prevotella sp. P6B1]|uniref:sialate O-acetylesterase n=1 Tax=Prevotella sp. P6B1 TaxID=1410613 RepID=UPI0009DCBF7D|nr:sialate O-acetylesterase [Prevotella sp. P6B1]
MKRLFWIVYLIGVLGLSYYFIDKACSKNYGHKVVVCIPVYGQSYALGEEATRITNFDSLRIKYNGRIVTEKLDYTFGYFDHSSQFKQWLKRVLHYDKKAFELSVYSMAEELALQLGEDTVICIFPGGHGMNTIQQLMKPVEPYNKFIREIATAYDKAQDRGWEFIVPAVCWMQGESDIVEYPDYDYKEYFHRMYNDLNTDIKQVTHQKEDIRIICYQASTITKGLRYKANNYDATEPKAPTAQMELIRDDSLVWVSGPTYPYDFVNESLHIDAVGQQNIGRLAAKSALGIIRNQKRNKGLVPMTYEVEGNDIRIDFNVPCPPLCFDTTQVKKVDNYGFNVVRRDGVDIVSDVTIDQNSVIIHCAESPQNAKLRYGINGEFLKGGRNVGPRGNLRDSEKYVSNWCLMFEKFLSR